MEAAGQAEVFIPGYTTIKTAEKKLTPREKRIAKIKEKVNAGTYRVSSTKLAKTLEFLF